MKNILFIASECHASEIYLHQAGIKGQDEV